MELFKELTDVSQMMTQKETLQSTLQSSRAGCGCNACLIHAYLNACFVQGVRRLGAAAVDLCHVALGVVDATWEYQLKPWDVTGGCVILLEAGGKLTTMDGQPYSVFSRSMLASNGPLHPQLLQYTQPKTEALLRQGFDLSEWFVPRGSAWSSFDPEVLQAADRNREAFKLRARCSGARTLSQVACTKLRRDRRPPKAHKGQNRL
eukprot:1146663-Pelagomonas_calceolata.AAC.6